MKESAASISASICGWNLRAIGPGQCTKCKSDSLISRVNIQRSMSIEGLVFTTSRDSTGVVRCLS